MSDVSSSEEAFFLVCKYLLTMNPPESILNPIQIVKGVPGFIVTLYQIAGQNRMCMIISHILFCFWVDSKGGRQPFLAGRIQRNRRFRGRESNGDSVPLAHDFACKV